MGRIKALSNGSKLLLVSAIALFLNLSLTWQRVEVDFGTAGQGEHLLDGWDAWGLLIGLLTLTLITLVVVVLLTDIEVSDEVPWDRIVFGLSLAILVLTLVKNLTDDGSTLASYVGVGLAGLIVVGCVLDRRQTQAEDRSHVVGARRP
jgi:hypothetical protein